MKVAWGETQEALRTRAPAAVVLEQLAPPLEAIAKFVQQNATWLVPLVAAIGALVVGIKAWSVAQGIINVLMDANPIGAIVLGIAALIAIIVLLVTHWDDVKQAAVDAFHWILDAVQTVWEWIQAELAPDHRDPRGTVRDARSRSSLTTGGERSSISSRRYPA